MFQAAQAELEAILHGAAIAPVNDRAFLRITGFDATRWLNGMVTNSIQSLATGEGNYNFLLNAQGRIVGDCTIYREPGDGEPTFLLATDNSQLTTLQETLDRFIIMDDVELQAVPKSNQTLLLLGPKTEALVEELGFQHPDPLRLKRQVVEGALITTPAPRLVPSFEIHLTNPTLEDLHSKATATGAVEVSIATLEAFRVYSGTPRYGTDIRNTDATRDLPQETNQPHALHFSKGCYLGQEIVERIRSRGQVHKLFTRFQLAGELPATLPAPLQVDGKPAGELTSAALVPLPDGPQVFALGYARREFLELGKQFTYSGGIATASAHPTVR